MSSIWTPGGEHEVPREGTSMGADPGGRPPGGGGRGATGAPPPSAEPTDEELAQQLRAMQEQLLETPAAVVIANHAFGLFELAALHLGVQPPQLGEAQLAIDALGALVEGLRDRLGDHEQQLGEGLAQLRLAYVQIRAAAAQEAARPTPGNGDQAGDDSHPG